MRFCAALLTVLISLAPLAVRAQAASTAPAPNETTAIVSAVGTVSRAPDTATLSAGIMTQDDDSAKAQSTNNAAYATLTSRLTALGVDPTKIRTLYYNVNFNARPSPAPRAAGTPVVPFPGRYGYIVNRQVAITFSNVADAGKIIDAVVAAGATTAGGVQYGLANRSAAYREALAAAIADASVQAAAVAAAAHMRVTGIRQIQVGSFPGGGFFPVPAAVPMQAVDGAPATSLSPSNVDVRANVTVIYKLQPAR